MESQDKMIQIFTQRTYRKSLKGLRHTIKLRDAGLTAPMKPNKVTKKSNLQDKRCVTKGQNVSWSIRNPILNDYSNHHHHHHHHHRNNEGANFHYWQPMAEMRRNQKGEIRRQCKGALYLLTALHWFMHFCLQCGDFCSENRKRRGD